MDEIHQTTAEKSHLNKTSLSNRNLLIVLVIVVAVIAVGAGIYLLSLQNLQQNKAPAYQQNSVVSVSQAPVSPKPTIPYKEEYQNPFEKKTQYQNPFENKGQSSQNPFDNLK